MKNKKNLLMVFALATVAMSCTLGASQDSSVIDKVCDGVQSAKTWFMKRFQLNEADQLHNHNVDQASIPQQELQAEGAVALQPKENIAPKSVTERNGYIYYFGDKIYNINSDAAHIAEQRASMTPQQIEDLIAENGGATCSSEKFDKALLKKWQKTHPVTLSMLDKMVGGTLFVGTVAGIIAYQYYNHIDDVENNE